MGGFVFMSDKHDTNIHKFHRQRIRKEARDGGISHWSPHKVLEYLLFFGVPQRDTNELAHELISTYGSLEKVFSASHQSLLSVKGVGENVASLIVLVNDLHKYTANLKVSKETLIFKDTKSIAMYMIPKFYNVDKEQLYVMTFDNQQKVISNLIVSEGLVCTSTISPRNVIQLAFQDNATSIVLVHNHPNGIPNPSYDDKVMTAEINDLARKMDVALLDHIIVADDHFCSMRGMGLI